MATESRIHVRGLAIAAGVACAAAVLVAVVLLTDGRSGSSDGAPNQTVVLAGQGGDLAVGVAMTPRRSTSVALRTTVLGPAGPASGLQLRFLVAGDGGSHAATAAPCGSGCYEADVPVAHPTRLELRIEGRGRASSTIRFTPPSQLPAPDATAIVHHAQRTIEHLRTLVVHSHLASDPTHALRTTYEIVAPDRLAYQNGDGSESVIIGDRRWDRTPGGAWVESSQLPAVRAPLPFWPTSFTNAHVLRTGRKNWIVSFLDPATPAWFTAWIDRNTYRTVRLDMIATAHFMHDRDGPFDSAVRIEPPRRVSR
jgi:hypothetical protein